VCQDNAGQLIDINPNLAQAHNRITRAIHQDFLCARFYQDMCILVAFDWDCA